MWSEVRALIDEAAARSDGRPAGAGPAGHRGKGQLSALPCAGRRWAKASPAGNAGTAQLRELSGPDASWYRTAVRTAPENALGCWKL